MKMSSDTDMYQTKTLRKFGQMGKHVQHKKPMMRAVVMRFLFVISPSYIQVKYADSSNSRTLETCVEQHGIVVLFWIKNVKMKKELDILIDQPNENTHAQQLERKKDCSRSRSSHQQLKSKSQKDPRNQLHPNKRIPLTLF